AQASAKGAARISRGEGAWYGNGVIYVVSTDGGPARQGQVFAYDPVAETFTCVFASPSADVLNAPDNICVSPRGGIVLCEDGDGREYLQGLTPDGEIFRFAENNVVLPSRFERPRGYAGDFTVSEWSGATFEPQDGDWLFVNLYSHVITLAITGPYLRGALCPPPPRARSGEGTRPSPDARWCRARSERPAVHVDRPVAQDVADAVVDRPVEDEPEVARPPERALGLDVDVLDVAVVGQVRAGERDDQLVDGRGDGDVGDVADRVVPGVERAQVVGPDGHLPAGGDAEAVAEAEERRHVGDAGAVVRRAEHDQRVDVLVAAQRLDVVAADEPAHR